MAKVIDAKLAAKLNALRLNQNISYEQLADRCGLGVATLKRMLGKGEFGELDGLRQVFWALGLGDMLMQAVIASVPDVDDSPYVQKRRKRASPQKRVLESAPASWPKRHKLGEKGDDE